MLIAILLHTPLWVWALLTALVALGLWQRRARRVRPARLLVLPMAMLALGLWSMAPGFVAQPGLGALWLLALLGAARWGRSLAPPAGTRWLPAQGVLALPGSWLPLALILSIFSLRYATGVALALQPAWRNMWQVQLPLALLFGTLSGVFLGRALGQWALTRPSAQRQPLDERAHVHAA